MSGIRITRQSSDPLSTCHDIRRDKQPATDKGIAKYQFKYKHERMSVSAAMMKIVVVKINRSA